MNKRICLITGATSGIGKVTAIELAKRGAQLIIHGRNKTKAEEIKKQIIEATGNTKIDKVIADMSSLEEVRKMAKEINDKYDRIDVLINNAGGILNEKRAATNEGFEKTIALNHLAPFLLTSLLLDKLKKSKDGRIINTSSMAYNMARPDFEDFLMEKKYSSMLAYGNAKLYLLLFTIGMSRRLKRDGIRNVTINALHPGVVKTNFSLESDSKMKFFFKFFNFFLISPEKGADTIIYLASADEARNFSGEFFKKRRPAGVRKNLTSDENIKRLWAISEKLTHTKLL